MSLPISREVRNCVFALLLTLPFFGCRTPTPALPSEARTITLSKPVVPRVKEEVERILGLRGYARLSVGESAMAFEKVYNALSSIIFPSVPWEPRYVRVRVNFFQVTNSRYAMQMVWNMVSNHGLPNEEEDPINIRKTEFEMDFAEIREAAYDLEQASARPRQEGAAKGR